jgi:LPXTG-motif cell wall-anchored protein
MQLISAVIGAVVLAAILFFLARSRKKAAGASA